MQSQQPGWRIPFVHLVCQPVRVFPMMHDFDPPMQQCSWIGQRQNKTTCHSHIGDMPNHMMIWVKHFNRVDHSTIYPPTSCQENTISNFHHSMPVSSHGKRNILGRRPGPILSMSTLNVKTSTESNYLLSLFIPPTE